MIGFANTTISVTRGETVDAYGDEAPSGTPVLQGVPASINEQRKRVFTEDSQEPRIIRFTTCRVSANTEVKVGDVIIDERTKVRYALDSFTQPANPVLQPDLLMEIKRIT